MINERDLLHSAQESRVAPRLRFLTGSSPGEGSRLLGDGVEDGVDIGVGRENVEAEIEAWRYIAKVMCQTGWSDLVRSWVHLSARAARAGP